MPTCDGNQLDMDYLTSEQALADYAELIWELKTNLGAHTAPVIGLLLMFCATAGGTLLGLPISLCTK